MSLPVYFVSQRQIPPKNGKYAAAGWHCAADGTLAAPENLYPADALVFDDRLALPDPPDALAESLLAQAGRIGAEVIVLDFERPVCPAACRFAVLLSKKLRTAAPARFCTDACEPILCYEPSKQTFAEFLAGARGWIELRPIRETVRYCVDAAEPREGGEHFSTLLRCRYRACSTRSELLLELFDTPETFRARFDLVKSRFSAAIGLQSELDALDFPHAGR